MTTAIETVKASIFKYLNHLHDADYMAKIVTSIPVSEFENIISLLLQSEDDETVGLTTLFIRDLVMTGSHHPQCGEFRKQYPNSLIVKTLEQMVFSTNHYICTVAVYTLGKTCSYDSIDAINQAFVKLRDIAPLALPRLIGEMGWLGAENLWEIIDSMLSSPVYVTRWAILDILREFNSNEPKEENELYQRKYRCLEQLRQDSNQYVRLEAEYEYQLLKFRSQSYELPKAIRRRMRKELIFQYEPKHSFAEISSRFKRHLSDNELKAYSVSELEEFIDVIFA